MEPLRSLPFSQKPVIGPYAESDEFRAYRHILQI